MLSDGHKNTDGLQTPAPGPHKLHVASQSARTMRQKRLHIPQCKAPSETKQKIRLQRQENYTGSTNLFSLTQKNHPKLRVCAQGEGKWENEQQRGVCCWIPLCSFLRGPHCRLNVGQLGFCFCSLKPPCLNDRNLLSCSLETRSAKSRCQQSWFPLRAVGGEIPPLLGVSMAVSSLSASSCCLVSRSVSV